MITLADVVNMEITNFERQLGWGHAKRAIQKGKSRIRSGRDREEKRPMDNYKGIAIGELCGNKYFFSLKDFRKSRLAHETNPKLGDNGIDTIGYRIDYKTSELKKNYRDILEYNMLVRPNEYHQNHVYVQFLVKTFGLQPEELVYGDIYPEIYLVGWATTDMLPEEPAQFGQFAGAYVLPVEDLNPIQTLDISKIPRVE